MNECRKIEYRVENMNEQNEIFCLEDVFRV